MPDYDAAYAAFLKLDPNFDLSETARVTIIDHMHFVCIDRGLSTQYQVESGIQRAAAAAMTYRGLTTAALTMRDLMAFDWLSATYVDAIGA